MILPLTVASREVPRKTLLIVVKPERKKKLLISCVVSLLPTKEMTVAFEQDD